MSESRTPLTPAMFDVLLALADGEKHGYAILKEVEISTGTLYGIIKRLLIEGFIVEMRTRPASGDDQRRRYYQLTAVGRATAIAEARRMESVISRARAKRLIHAVKPA
jgi:DNA-binding PadR family transcriptional regulator